MNIIAKSYHMRLEQVVEAFDGVVADIEKTCDSALCSLASRKHINTDLQDPLDE